MRKMFLVPLIAASLALAACGFGGLLSGPPDNPGTVAQQTVLDEQVAISVELAYQAAALTVSTATKAGLVKGETAEKLIVADRKAYDAVVVVRSAYQAGNARSYADAAAKAHDAIRAVILLVSG